MPEPPRPGAVIDHTTGVRPESIHTLGTPHMHPTILQVTRRIAQRSAAPRLPRARGAPGRAAARLRSPELCQRGARLRGPARRPAAAPRGRAGAESGDRHRLQRHAAGAPTVRALFYGTANSSQMLLEAMGLHVPGAAFVHPNTALREALTRAAVRTAPAAGSEGRCSNRATRRAGSARSCSHRGR